MTRTKARANRRREGTVKRPQARLEKDQQRREGRGGVERGGRITFGSTCNHPDQEKGGGVSRES